MYHISQIMQMWANLHVRLSLPNCNSNTIKKAVVTPQKPPNYFFTTIHARCPLTITFIVTLCHPYI